MHPVLFELPGGAPVPTYGVLVAVALLLGWITSLANAKARGLEVERLGLAYLIAVVAGLLGARALWVAQHPDSYDGVLGLLQPRSGQMALGGGILAAALASWAYCKKEGLSWVAWLDALAGPVLMGLALERFGAFLAGDEFGLYAPDVAWAVEFPNKSPAHLFQLYKMPGAVSPSSRALPVHPTQLYAASSLGLGAAWLWWLDRRQRGPAYAGQFAAWGFIVYALGRMVIEPIFQAERRPIEIAGISLDLIAGLFYVGLGLLWLRRGRARGA